MTKKDFLLLFSQFAHEYFSEQFLLMSYSIFLPLKIN